uniref:Protein kinase domain-containing protein n=1 Tax=Vitis vinifera TaxID=29760 RepID=A5BHK7_VITVI|nr:hypothetical protein VITISV_017846 [Vitis vinifera]
MGIEPTNANLYVVTWKSWYNKKVCNTMPRIDWCNPLRRQTKNIKGSWKLKMLMSHEHKKLWRSQTFLVGFNGKATHAVGQLILEVIAREPQDMSGINPKFFMLADTRSHMSSTSNVVQHFDHWRLIDLEEENFTTSVRRGLKLCIDRGTTCKVGEILFYISTMAAKGGKDIIGDSGHHHENRSTLRTMFEFGAIPTYFYVCDSVPLLLHSSKSPNEDPWILIRRACQKQNSSQNMEREKVAIKKINDVFEHVSDATRILREIKLLRLLQHPNIVEIKHIMLPPSRRESRDIYVVFELIEYDFHPVIKANDDLTPEHYQFFSCTSFFGV